MEKSELSEFEKKCIQEEPAFCSAACPFHLDVKSFMAHMAKGAPDKAFKILEKTLPLPEIMARVCDGPCESACIRNRLDAPLAVGKLERACAENRTRQKKYFPAPAKNQGVGIWGSGLSSLVAAWDLALKGYEIVVFEPTASPGSPLGDILEISVLDKELARLETFGVKFTPHTPFETFLNKREKFNALYLGMDGAGGPQPPETDPFSLQSLSDPGIFAGGLPMAGENITRTSYPVLFAFQGRKAAASIDRILSRVSLTAGREKEGPFQTQLSTDISRETIRPPVQFDQAKGYTLEKAAREADRCIQCDCSRCLRACNTYLTAFKGFPGQYARKIYNNLSIVMGDKKANTLINSCTLCDLCKRACPNDFSMADLCLSARQEMVETGKMPPSAHEFALGEMAHAMGEACAFARHAPGRDSSRRIFFPGCQLTGSSPGQVKQVYDWLTTALDGNTGLVSSCCGAPAFWAGDRKKFKEAVADITGFWDALGQPDIITACTSCTQMLGTALPGAKITSLYHEMAGALEKLPLATETGPDPKAIIDPCTARHDRGVRQAVRQIAETAGIKIREIKASGERTECCGFGGLVFNANPDLSKKIIENRALQGDQDYIAYCAMCRDRLARTGKNTRHILDLFWPETTRPGLRNDPGFSRRRINLAGFKREMAGGQPEEFKDHKLVIRPDTLARIEDEFILISDIETVMAQENHCFSNPAKGSEIRFFRPANVCFWVEFKPPGETGEAYEILDAWSHRMKVAPDPTFEAARPGKDTPEHDESVLCKTCAAPLGLYKNHVEYLGSRFDVALPQCRTCGAVYISPALSRGKMAEVEKILEDK